MEQNMLIATDTACYCCDSNRYNTLLLLIFMHRDRAIMQGEITVPGRHRFVTDPAAAVCVAMFVFARVRIAVAVPPSAAVALARLWGLLWGTSF